MNVVRRFFRPLWFGLCSLMLVLCACNSTASAGSASTNTASSLPSSSPSPTTTALPAHAVILGTNDWPTYHHDMLRGGYVATISDPHTLSQAWKTQVDGAIYAEPLVVQGHVLIVTENDSIYSLDSRTGRVQWQTNVGTPVSRSTLPCGNIDPLGITSTPVYDPQTNLLFAVAEVEGPSHFLIGIDLTTGQVRIRRNIDLPGMDPHTHQQRAALALYQNHVYVSFGGLAGDCGQYRGTVVASQTNGQGELLSYLVPTPREGAIWATSGPAINAQGQLFVSVGNGELTQGDWDHSDSVLRLSATLNLEDGFAPTQWAQDNASDADLGSTGPLPLPNNLIFVAGKSGIGYLLHADKLGGVGGQISQKMVCPGARSMGGIALVGSQIFVPCDDGVQQLTIGPNNQITLGWKNRQLKLPPVVGGHTLYSLDAGGTLYAADMTTGKVHAQIALNGVAHFATPTLSGNQIFVGTMDSVFAVTTS